MNRIACVVFLVFVASAVAAAQRDVTTVEVVQVPVVVDDRGQAVRGLTRDNFQLFVNGKPQPIDYFDMVDFSAPESQRVDPRQRRLYLLVFDLVFSPPNAVYRAQKAAAEYVEAAPESDLFAVASYTSNRGLQLAVPFTRDRLALRRAIAQLRERQGGDPLLLTMSPGERSAFASERGLFDGGIDARSGSLWLNDTMNEPLRRVVANQIDDLSDLAARLAPLEGQKHVVLLSGGFSAPPVFGGVAGAAQIRQASFEPQRRTSFSFGDSTVTGRLLDMHSSFNAAGVVLDAVDVNGLPGPWDPNNNDALHALALDTGGSVVQNRNDLRAALQQLTDRQRVVYLLGFRPAAGSRKDNSIKVKVRNAPHSLVTYRQSYSTTLPKPSATDGLRLADILENDIPQTGVSVAAKVTAGARRATVTVDVPPAELTALGGADGDALIYIYSGHAAIAFEQTTIAADRAHLTHDFDLPPGRYTAKVLVRWDGALGYAHTDFTVE